MLKNSRSMCRPWLVSSCWVFLYALRRKRCQKALRHAARLWHCSVASGTEPCVLPKYSFSCNLSILLFLPICTCQYCCCIALFCAAARCLDRYFELRTREVEHKEHVDIDSRLIAVVERMLNRWVPNSSGTHIQQVVDSHSNTLLLLLVWSPPNAHEMTYVVCLVSFRPLHCGLEQRCPLLRPTSTSSTARHQHCVPVAPAAASLSG